DEIGFEAIGCSCSNRSSRLDTGLTFATDKAGRSGARFDRLLDCGPTAGSASESLRSPIRAATRTGAWLQRPASAHLTYPAMVAVYGFPFGIQQPLPGVGIVDCAFDRMFARGHPALR